MIIEQLPALQVVLPLLSAPLCLLLPNGRLPWLLALVTSWGCLLMAALLLHEVTTLGAISYMFGGWGAPWGIEYRIDTANAFVLLIVAGIGAVVTPFASLSVAKEIPADRVRLFYTAYLLCLTGLLGITITGDAFNLFVFLEISSLSSYVLISMGRDRRALTSAFQYLVMGTVGATFILIGVGLVYMMTGTLNMVDLAVRLPQVSSTRTVLAASAFLTVGISLKLALFPLHLWMPNAYAYAPSVVTAFLAATATKVAVYMLLRFMFTVFGVVFAFYTVSLSHLMILLAVVGVLSASIVAIFQDDVKRMLAYSSVAQIGYLVLGVGLASVTGLTACLLHLFNHALMKGALFLCLGCVFYRLGSAQITDMNGLARRMPWTMAAFVAGGLSLIGAPLTVGLVSKWYLLQGALERGWWPVAVVILVGSLLAVIYVWRVVEAAYFQPEHHPRPWLREAPLALLVPTWTLVVANLYFGVDTDLTVGVAQQAAETLFAGLGVRLEP